jgi:hypothetical protein
MEAIVKTKSNYKNCNGKILTVKSCNGDFICCLVPMYGFSETGEAIGNMISADFSIKEIISLKNY